MPAGWLVEVAAGYGWAAAPGGRRALVMKLTCGEGRRPHHPPVDLNLLPLPQTKAVPQASPASGRVLTYGLPVNILGGELPSKWQAQFWW